MVLRFLTLNDTVKFESKFRRAHRKAHRKKRNCKSLYFIRKDNNKL